MRRNGVIVPVPRDTAYDPYDVASGAELRTGVPMSGNDSAWQGMSAPLFEALRRAPMTLPEIKAWSKVERRAIKDTEECLAWLSLRGRVVLESGLWRVA